MSFSGCAERWGADVSHREALEAELEELRARASEKDREIEALRRALIAGTCRRERPQRILS